MHRFLRQAPPKPTLLTPNESQRTLQRAQPYDAMGRFLQPPPKSPVAAAGLRSCTFSGVISHGPGADEPSPPGAPPRMLSPLSIGTAGHARSLPTLQTESLRPRTAETLRPMIDMPLRRGPLPELRVESPPPRKLPAPGMGPASPQTQTRYRPQRLHDDKQWFERAVLQRAPPAAASWGLPAESEGLSPPLRPLSPCNKPLRSTEKASPLKQLPISQSAPCLTLYSAGPAAGVKLYTHSEKPRPQLAASIRHHDGVQTRPPRPVSYASEVLHGRAGPHTVARLQKHASAHYPRSRQPSATTRRASVVSLG